MHARSILTALFCTAALAAVGCGGTSTDGDGTSEQDATTDQVSNDLTVLKVERVQHEISIQNGKSIADGARPSAPGFDASKCVSVSDSKIDCTETFESAFGLRALGRIVVSESSALCTVVKITTVSKAAAIAGANGIGSFYSTDNDRGNRGRLVGKSDLKSAGKVTLKSGEAGELHEFGGLGACDIGGRFGTSSFKPYMMFTGSTPSAKYRNWDATPVTTSFSNGNYGIDWKNTTLDRSADLLR